MLTISLPKCLPTIQPIQHQQQNELMLNLGLTFLITHHFYCLIILTTLLRFADLTFTRYIPEGPSKYRLIRPVL